MTAPKVSLTPFVASQAQWTIALPMLSMPSLKSMVLPSLGPLLLGISEVTQPPELLHYIQPKMPIAARNYKQGGKLMLRLVVEVSGQVSEAVVLSAEPEGIFNQASITAAKKWRFKPAHLDGEAVRVFVDVPINFKVN
ncbi:MAG: energy transducer TonB [Shewanella sp.]